MMLNHPAMNKESELDFESKKNKKAFAYTAGICGTLLLLFILISWKVMPPSVPVVQDLIEINLGNNDEGFGEKQPLIKGDRAQEAAAQPKQPTVREAAAEKVDPDDNAEENAAPVTKVEKKVEKVKTTTVAPTPVPAPPKPVKPKITMPGTGKTGGNNPTEDNGYTMQGNKPGGKGDAGDPSGNKDSYGKDPGGKVGGGPKVISGSRKIVHYYTFPGELPKATIFALINVSASGKGTFLKLVKPSTSFDSKYATAISNYLRSMEFDKATEASNATVQFNFTVN